MTVLHNKIKSPVLALPGFTFGCDPEMFILDPKGRYVSAEGLLPGTKEAPYPVEGGAVQVDGMAAEFNIDPVTSWPAFDLNIRRVVGAMQDMLPKGHTLSAVPAVVFDKDVWDKSPDIAKELGCSPDFNAWTGKVNPIPHLPDNPRMRTASGHLHLGWTDGESLTDESHAKNCRDLVQQLDWYLGAWSVEMDPDPTRRQLYGKAGAMRYKEYGVEYRVLSNFWLTSEERRLAVWNRMQIAIKNMSKSFLPEVAADFTDAVIQSINSSKLDSTLATRYYFPVSSLGPN